MPVYAILVLALMYSSGEAKEAPNSCLPGRELENLRSERQREVEEPLPAAAILERINKAASSTPRELPTKVRRLPCSGAQ